MIAEATEKFLSSGRGPELVNLVWGLGQCQLVGANYRNPSESAVRHVRFVKAQAVMITPDEVVGLEDPAGLVDLGVTDWLKGLNTGHLTACTHLRARFYDEAVDVICEGVHFGDGPLKAIQQADAMDGPSGRR